MIQYPKKRFISFVEGLLINILLPGMLCGQGAHVFAGSEISVFNSLSLGTTPSMAWSTDRSATPGYFSAVEGAVFTDAGGGAHNLIDGYVKYYRNNSAGTPGFTFPVGQATAYRPVKIGGAMPANSSFATAWFSGDPSIVIDPTDASVHDRNNRGPGVLAVLAMGFWDWQTISGSAPGMNITVNIPDVSADATADNLILVGWDGSDWINLSGSAGVGPHSGNWTTGITDGSDLTGTWQPGITALAIGSLDFALPLKLESFTGYAKDCEVVLTWKTADENNTDRFIIESSADGLIWKAIGDMPAQGHGDGRWYNYTMLQPDRAKRYRLRMIDLGGKATYSKSIQVTSNCTQNRYMTIQPNPVSTGRIMFTVVLQTHYSGKAAVWVRNIHGQPVMHQAVDLQRGMNTIDLQTAGLLPGVYLVSVTERTGKRIFDSQKLIKQ